MDLVSRTVRLGDPTLVATTTEIVLATLNAKYIHAAFGLRYLMANLQELQPRTRLMEFDIHQRPADIAETLLEANPKIIGLGVYIWNVAPIAEVVAALKRVRPDVMVILGGPEVSYETADQPIIGLADYTITGEADLKFAQVCRELLEGNAPATKILEAPPPDLSRLTPPYALYNAEDVAHRVIYVEASRGCPFTCEFCLSSLDIPVRQAPLDEFLRQLESLLERGVKQFKFVDRTFNLNLQTSQKLLQFFLDRHQPGRFYHFEMIPDRLPEGLRETVSRFPPGALQFEVGVQTFNEEVCRLISRRQDMAKLEDNFRFLRAKTGVHIHADLIAGLPGESLESFGQGFDRLVALDPQEIQVGLLKRLRGTPIVRHDQAWAMVYNPHPPYEVLQTKLIPFAQMQRMRRFARYWDLIANSGNFGRSKTLLWSRPGSPAPASPFVEFLKWSDWLYARLGRTDAIALGRLAAFLFRYLTEELGHEGQSTAELLWSDYQSGQGRDKPAFLHPYIPDRPKEKSKARAVGPKRQSRHWAGA